MTVRYVAPIAQGTGDGSTAANAAAWTDMDNQVNLASADPGTYEVRILVDGFSYSWTSSGQVATIAHGGQSATKNVVIHGWSLAANAEAQVTIVGDRSTPYQPVATSNDDVWQPAGSNGNPGKIPFQIATGAGNIQWAAITCDRLQSLFTVTGVVGAIHGRDILATNCRRLWACNDATTGTPVGIKGTAANPAVWQRIRGFGFPKQFIYLSGCSYMTFQDIYGDSQGQAYDGNPSLISLVGNIQAAASGHITIKRWGAANCIAPAWTATPLRLSLTAGSPAPTGGTFALTVNGVATSALAYNASNATIKQAVATAGGWATTAVFTSGAITSTLTLSFGQQLTATNPGTITFDGSALTGGTITMTTAQAWAPIQAGYWQGDGITTEEWDTDIFIGPGHAKSMADGGMDLKSVNTKVRGVIAEDCKRSWRAHQPLATANPVVLVDCRSINPQLRTYPAGVPLAGQKGVGTQCGVQADGPVVVVDMWHSDAASSYAAQTTVFETDSSTGRITVCGGRADRKAGSTLTAALSSGTVTTHELVDNVT